MDRLRVLHVIDNFNIGGIQELIFNLHKHSTFKHDGRGYAGSLSPEMADHGFTLNPGHMDYDVLVGHTVGGWSYDDTFREAREHGLKTVEVMHSPARSPTNPDLVDGFIGLNQAAVDSNPQMKNRVKIYAIANNVFPAFNRHPKYDVGRVSRVVPEKCPDVFAYIALQLPNYSFVLGGDGNMLDYIRRQNIPNLELTGMVRDFNAFLSKVRVFAFPTRDECCSMSVAMGQSAGLPCVVQDIPPLRETTGGYALFATSPADFALRVLDLLDCPRVARQLAEEGLDWALRNFTPDIICRKWEAYLKGVCAS